MFLTPEQTGGPHIFRLWQNDHYLAVEIRELTVEMREFNIEELAQAINQPAGETWRENASLIVLACCGGKLFEWLNIKEGQSGL